MKLEEAKRIVELEFGYSRDMHEDPERHDEALKVIVEALEKQIPRKPIKRMKNPDGTDQFSCAVCGRLWWEKDFITKFCDGCGTAVDREANDEKKD